MKDDFGSWAETHTTRNEGEIRILHVDDERDFADLASNFLERESDAFDVITEYSPTDALERISADEVDCIVSDYDMPERNGLEFFDDIPEKFSDIPFILFTGKGSEEVASEAFSAGITDYLQKEAATDQFTVLVNRIEQAVSNFWVQQRLELTRRRFKTLVEKSNDAILVVDATGTILYATAATNHILGKSPDELIGTDGFEPIHTEDVTAVIEELETLIENPEHRAQVEFRYHHADGSWIWVEVRGRNLLENDEISGIVVYVRDIDDRKTKELELERKEQTFRAVFDEASDAMVIACDAGVYMDANKAAGDLFGLEIHELIGRTIQEFAPDDYDFENAWQQFQESESERGLFPLARPDGERRIVEFSATRDVLPNRHLSILRDVTEQNQNTEPQAKN